jgi:hypothetical protein
VRDVVELIDEQIKALDKVELSSPVGYEQGLKQVATDHAAMIDYTSCRRVRGFGIPVSLCATSTPVNQGPPAAE